MCSCVRCQKYYEQYKNGIRINPTVKKKLDEIKLKIKLSH